MVYAGETSARSVESAMREVLLSADLIDVEYVVARVETDLWLNNYSQAVSNQTAYSKAAFKQAAFNQTANTLAGDVRLFVAARFGRTRLIDNLGCVV